MKPGSFNLRTSQSELSLSLYEADRVEPQSLVDAAPGEGWGVVSIQTEAIRDVGFVVNREIDEEDPVFGPFHVSATPPAYDEEGQIPLQIRSALAGRAKVVLAPALT